MSGDPSYPLFPILAFLAFVLVLVPFPWHFRAWNSGTCLFMFWVSVSCLIQFVNSVVWHGTVENIAPRYCDLATHFSVAAAVGIPAASFCISRRIFAISCVRSTGITHKDKVRDVVIDLCIAFVFPLVCIIFQYVVQGHRFDIIEDAGCFSVTVNVVPAYVLVYMWPLIIGCASFALSCMSLWKFIRHRAALGQMMSAGGALSQSQFLRLLMLSLTEMMCTIPLSIWTIYLSASSAPPAQWTSWDDIHFNFGRVGQIPNVFWRSNKNTVMQIEFTTWLPLFCSLLFTILFDLSPDARRHYAAGYTWVRRKLGLPDFPRRSPFKSAQPLSSSIALPELRKYASPPPPQKYRASESSLFSTTATNTTDAEKYSGFDDKASFTTSTPSTPTAVAPAERAFSVYIPTLPRSAHAGLPRPLSLPLSAYSPTSPPSHL
ncbi:STE3-domain-containing protein [Peniophora sp. CONT]|nr:STE3-domain-containing protein [Peniophora sp. CONT]